MCPYISSINMLFKRSLFFINNNLLHFIGSTGNWNELGVLSIQRRLLQKSFSKSDQKDDIFSQQSSFSTIH